MLLLSTGAALPVSGFGASPRRDHQGDTSAPLRQRLTRLGRPSLTVAPAVRNFRNVEKRQLGQWVSRMQHIASLNSNVQKAPKNPANTTNRPPHNVRPFILPSQSVVLCGTYFPASFLLSATIIQYSMLYSTIPHSGVELRCAVQSSALCDGIVALLVGSAGTVVAHFSIGLTGIVTGNPGAVRPSRHRRGRRQDKVHSVVPGLHQSSSAGADSFCQMAPINVSASGV